MKVNQKKIIVFLLIVSFFGFLIFGFFNLYFPKNPKETKEILIEIEKGKSFFEIAKELKEKGLIRSKLFFSAFLIATGKARGIKAGYYYLSESLTPFEIIEKLVKGEVAKTKIVIKEGKTLKDIANYFEEKGICKKEEFFKIVGRPIYGYQKGKDFSKKLISQFQFLKEKPEGLSLEGFLFPDTYEVKVGESCLEVIKKILLNFEKKTKEIREKVKKAKKNFYQVLIMASILEKEVKTKKEKEIVAGILWKRLKNNWLLQVDATLTYLIGKGTFQLTKKDLKIPSPYNSYYKLGLPPTPISNPGLESLKSALSPKFTDFWYYLTNPKGKAEFSRTLKEHNLKRFKYYKK